MKKPYTTIESVNGVDHVFELEQIDRQFVARVDGKEVATRQKSWKHYVSFFYMPFEVDGVECSFISTNRSTRPRLAIGEKYVNCDYAYGCPPLPVPSFYWFLFGISILFAIDAIVLVCLGVSHFLTPVVPLWFSYLGALLLGCPLGVKKTDKAYRRTFLFTRVMALVLWACGNLPVAVYQLSVI